MNLDKIKKIYLAKKDKELDHNFIKSIFDEIKKEYKEEKIIEGKDANQSWNSWSGKALQELIKFIVEDYVSTLNYPIGITDDTKLRNKKLSPELDKVRRNIEIFYDSYSIIPDADIVIYDKSNYKIIAVLSCKASLRERVAQAAYWKLKFQYNDTTKDILYYLLSTDNDGDFLEIGENISRDRVIVEYGEIDRAYIFRDIPESDKVKNFSKIFDDLKVLFGKWFK
ncbi:MAG: hypothetical protein A2312_02955 [Candidatus Staskawiczbacteria bacterium RIFOXYB2_FULL_32_9]|uniref:BsaWI restriction endonuclease type 2 domain-containing protein n=1 Tax=Candidatus Staskawiczbacteria bacterium RIFOXYD1_FULL_32_13 TaxID=1802234 RepID=A0A1G2JML0_9BACT|nr:MAG: hypothetical protein UR22_C0002G0075 [Parcubacteria group bacterium GW2011_GWC2_32_10]OGZ78674.1 MAG: hypothetical protein A2360_00570 [Candidatus Staskawiczbacteria bacterium RIFOXYB1_FULL_32_11]OGZ80251.1 MAG: hypothetical protein A2256_04465 [Candidatus Staskawiczbacteria bacterium RIFOXYA2_FULL_32_7]OGZ81533.1 MAG: hypothetical protein A2312_02955 [Candidatus Staskawiczbacteria bacterium RIFOXYB2_FULL_32_9]OGZ88089.1 MAG: hypothetical protein A2463_00125 [Candidatus Staskawiczbacter